MSEQPFTIVHDCTKSERRVAADASRGRTGRRDRMQQRVRLAQRVYGGIFYSGLVLSFFIFLTWRGVSKLAGPSSQLPRVVTLSFEAFACGAACWLVTFVLFRLTPLPPQWGRWPGRVTYTFDANGMTLQRPARTTIYNWSCFDRFIEGPNVFVLRLAGGTAFVIPLRLFADESERDSLRSWAQQHVAQRAIPVDAGFPVIPL